MDTLFDMKVLKGLENFQNNSKSNLFPQLTQLVLLIKTTLNREKELQLKRMSCVNEGNKLQSKRRNCVN